MRLSELGFCWEIEAFARTFEHAGQHAMPVGGVVCAALAGCVERGGRVRYLGGALDERYAALAEMLPSCVEAHIVEGAGYDVHLARPDAYVQLLSDFLAQVSVPCGCSARAAGVLSS